VSGPPADLERLRRRLQREHHARQEAEAIAERVTADLYATSRQLEHANAELHRTNEELQAVNQTMRDFVAVASHDLRSPLTAILGFSAALTQLWTEIEEAQKLDFIGSIQPQGENLRDCGSGVPEEFRSRLFGRFARSDAARASGVAGTGLGLSIVRGLARANGGDVWYESNIPHGSVFGVRLPAAAV
jgi:signal transduction histidine kinase